MITGTATSERVYDVVIVAGGIAGVSAAVARKHANIENACAQTLQGRCIDCRMAN